MMHAYAVAAHTVEVFHRGRRSIARDIDMVLSDRSISPLDVLRPS